MSDKKITIEVDLSGFVTKEELVSAVEKVVKEAINGPSIPSLPKCVAGPDIKEIYDISKLGLTVNFYGEEVERIGWSVGKSDQIIFGDAFNATNDRPKIAFPSSLPAGVYTLSLNGILCSGGSKMDFTIPSDEVATPPEVDPPIVIPPVDSEEPFGTFRIKDEDTVKTHIKHPDFAVGFKNGKVSDNTPGLTIRGGQTYYQGRKRWYMFNHKMFESAPDKPVVFQDVDAPDDGVFSVLAYDCDTSITYAVLREERTSGWIRQTDHTKCSIKYFYWDSKSQNKGYSAIPDWFHLSAKMIVPLRGPKRDFAGKLVATSFVNNGDKVDDWHNIGIITHRNSNATGEWSFATYQAHGIADDLASTDPIIQGKNQAEAEKRFYSAGYSRAQDVGAKGNSIITTQLSEDNIHGLFKNGDTIIDSYYQGVCDYAKSQGITDIRKTTGYGEYGMDGTLHGIDGISEKQYKESLTDHLYDRYDAGNGAWGGLNPFYAREQFKRRNRNDATYFKDNPITIAFGSGYLNDLTQLGTGTYQGQDRRVTSIGYSMPYYESASNNLLNQTIIKFPNGELSNQNDYTPACPSLLFRHGAIETMLLNGYSMWDVEGIGIDPTKVNLIMKDGRFDGVRWKPNGATEWQQYVPGKDGAPLNDKNGITARMSALPANAALAGSEAIRDIQGRLNKKIELISYESSAGNFAAKGGDMGFTINGHGPINKNNFDQFKLKDQGFMFHGAGDEGEVLIWIDESILPSQWKKVSAMGKTIDKAWGTQLYIIKL